jgi:hypothetical protein
LEGGGLYHARIINFPYLNYNSVDTIIIQFLPGFAKFYPALKRRNRIEFL